MQFSDYWRGIFILDAGFDLQGSIHSPHEQIDGETGWATWEWRLLGANRMSPSLKIKISVRDEVVFLGVSLRWDGRKERGPAPLS